MIAQSTLNPNAGNDHIVLPEKKASSEHKLHGRVCKLRATLL